MAQVISILSMTLTIFTQTDTISQTTDNRESRQEKEMTQMAQSIVDCVSDLDLTGLDSADTNRPRATGWYYDFSVFPPRLVVPERPVVTSCAGASPQDVWGNLWSSQEARDHYFSCPSCKLWDRIENRW